MWSWVVVSAGQSTLGLSRSPSYTHETPTHNCMSLFLVFFFHTVENTSIYMDFHKIQNIKAWLQERFGVHPYNQRTIRFHCDLSYPTTLAMKNKREESKVQSSRCIKCVYYFSHKESYNTQKSRTVSKNNKTTRTFF